MTLFLGSKPALKTMSWDQCDDSKNIFAKIVAKKLAFIKG
jgi:hypothetical protein